MMQLHNIQSHLVTRYLRKAPRNFNLFYGFYSNISYFLRAYRMFNVLSYRSFDLLCVRPTDHHFNGIS